MIKFENGNAEFHLNLKTINQGIWIDKNSMNEIKDFVDILSEMKICSEQS